MDKQFIDEQIEKAILYNMTHENCLSEIVKQTVIATVDELIRINPEMGVKDDNWKAPALKKQCE